MQTDDWNTFMTTGRIADYLDYRRHGDRPVSRDMRGENEHGAERYSDRNGTTDHANW